MTGTTIAQAIPVAISPILTRIYSPEDFGIFALYMSVASMLSVIATGRYELAIMLPKEDDDSVNIVAISVILSFLMSFISFIFIAIFNTQITNILGNPRVSNWLYFIPLTVLLTGVYQSFNYWSNRQKQYKILAASRVVQSFTASSSNLGMGISGFGSAGLVMGSIFGQFFATFILVRVLWREEKKLMGKVNINKMLFLLKKYIKFPQFDMLASLLNVAAQQVSNILFNTIFNSIIAGYYYLTQKMLSLPVSLIAASVLDVFKEQAAKDFQVLGNCKEIYTKTFIKLLVLSLMPSVVLYIYAVDIFTLIFGQNWAVSGEYARILIPMLTIRFVSSPLSFMLYIGEKQEWNLLGNMLFLTGTLLSFYFASSALETVIYLSYSFSFIYLMYLFFSAKIAKVF
jgi:O-antigen/teichoic acid export membrane protein